MSEPRRLYCSFCGKSDKEVAKLVAGPTVFICNECVDLCRDVVGAAPGENWIVQRAMDECTALRDDEHPETWEPLFKEGYIAGCDACASMIFNALGGGRLADIKAKTMKDDSLIDHLPKGDVQYAQGPHGWDVGIYKPGSVERIATLASNLDKSVAAWIAAKMRAAR
jgi:hypothetical protein